MFSIEAIMSVDLKTLTENDSVHDARALMTEHHIRHVPIVDADGGLVGLVSQRDVLAAAPSSITDTGSSKRSRVESRIPLGRVMVREVDIIGTHTSLREAAMRMQTQKHGCLPVVRDDKLIGLVTDSDFVAVAINLLEQLEVQEPVEDDDDIDELEKPGSLVAELNSWRPDDEL